MMICLGMFITSCGKDDGPDKPASALAWKDALGAYKADGNLKLTINDLSPTTPKEAALSTGTGESAKIVLTNIIPDMATVEIDNVVVTPGGDNRFTFEGESRLPGDLASTTVTVKGTLSVGDKAEKTLNLNVARTVASPIIGSWKLAPAIASSVRYVIIDARTGDTTTDELLNSMLGPLLGDMLAQKVTDVTVTLGPDGLFDVNWTETGKSEPTGMPEGVKSLVAIQYFVTGDKLYLALDKSVVPLLAAILPEGVDLDTLMGALAKDMGGFIAIPVDVLYPTVLDSSIALLPNVVFTVGKEMLAPILPVLMPALTAGMTEGLPAYLLPLLQGLPDMVSGAEYFNVGLSFMRP
jgi:hypothetical protein